MGTLPAVLLVYEDTCQEDHVYMNRCQLELMQHLLQIESACH
jgi:hypothetical protein